MVGKEACVTKGGLAASGLGVAPGAVGESREASHGVRGEKSERLIVAMRPMETPATAAT